MASGSLRLAHCWNRSTKLFVGLIDAPIVGPFVRRGMINIRAMSADVRVKTIRDPRRLSARPATPSPSTSCHPGAKTWWRNFLGEGPITLLKLDGADRTRPRGRRPRREERASR